MLSSLVTSSKFSAPSRENYLIALHFFTLVGLDSFEEPCKVELGFVGAIVGIKGLIIVLGAHLLLLDVFIYY